METMEPVSTRKKVGLLKRDAATLKLIPPESAAQTVRGVSFQPPFAQARKGERMDQW